MLQAFDQGAGWDSGGGSDGALGGTLAGASAVLCREEEGERSLGRRGEERREGDIVKAHQRG